MKSISDILAGAQILLPMSFDLQACFEEYLNPEQRTFLALLRVGAYWKPSQGRSLIQPLQGKPMYLR
jgi:hypothetical protein